jgi:cystathionine beta-lyase/cystathionine gamma-synthase
MSLPPTSGFTTRAVHAARGFSGDTGAVMPPVYLTSTFASGNADGFDYTRSGNPNFRLLQQSAAALEGARFATCFASGVSAITAVVSTLKSGDVVVAEENVYGCTYRLFDRVFGKFGVQVRYVDLADEANWAIIPELRPALVWLESPTNPLLKIVDIAGISRVAAAVPAPVLVDNTFASSFLQRPLALGATLSLASTTKYINGHSDCLGGLVATNDPVWQEHMVFAQKALGLQPSPFDAWLTARGQRTLALRMERHCANGLALAKWLESRRGVRMVRYPFLPSHPQHDLARRQMHGGSGIVIAELDCPAETALAFCRRLKFFTLAESLGGVESLICHPPTMTHASVPPEVRRRIGIGDGLLRFSVGIEDFEDLRADVDAALTEVLR